MGAKRDWHTGEGYPGDDATPAEWAWEFLRRNPEYRRAWESDYRELSERVKKVDPHWSPLPSDSASDYVSILALNHAHFPDYMLHRICAEGGGARDRAVARAVLDYRNLCRRFRLRHMKNPDEDYDVDTAGLFEVDACRVFRSGVCEIPKGCIAVVIDERFMWEPSKAAVKAVIATELCMAG